MRGISSRFPASPRARRVLQPVSWSLALLLVFSAQPAAGQVINEIMQNPSAVADSAGEWFELFNPTGAAIDINGWTVEDNDSDSFVIVNGGPLLIPAGGFLVLGNNADSLTNGGVSVDYEFSGMFLANGADELVLRDLFLAEVDRVEWDGGPAFPDPNGASMALATPASDNNVGANWCESSTVFGAGDRGTPGAANDCPVVVPEVVIHEIMQNPAAVSDGSGEWFELHNPTAAAIDIDGWTVADNDFDSFVIVNGGPLLIPAGGFLVLGNNDDSLTNGGVTVDFEYSGFILGNSADEVVLLDGSLNEVDRVEYDNGATFPDPNGASMALIDPALDNNVGANWCTSSTSFGDGDLGTPGAANDCVVVVPSLVVNEIMQNPSAVSDGSGEWFEIFNPTSDPVDLEGWTVADNDFDSFVITGGPLVIAPGGFLVLGNNADSLTNGGVTVDFEYSGFFLANGGDEVVLFDAFLNEVDRVEYDGGPAFPDPNGASMSLVNPALDNNLGANWCEASTPFGDGDFGTPGAANDCPPPPIVINEVDADTPGNDALEFVELFDGGQGSTPLDGLVVVFFNGSDDASYDAFDLTGFTTDADGYFLLGNAGVSPAPDIVFGGNGLQNGADAVALYIGSAADFPNDTPVTTENLLDAVVYDTNDADDPGLLPLLNPGQPQLNEGGNGDKDNHSNQRCPNGFGGGRNTDLFDQAVATPGAFNTCPPLEIFTIQGDGLVSPFDGFVVSSEQNVVTCLAPDGFFMQTPPSRTDGILATSDGIFVFTDSPPGLSVGDLVDVEGEIDEFFGLTEFRAGSTILVTGSDPGQVPAPVVFNEFVPSPDPTTPSCGAFEFECYESMRVEVTDAFVAGADQEFGSDPFAEIHINAGGVRVFRELGAEFPGLGFPIPVWDGNPETFELDPDKLGLGEFNIPAGSTVSATGVLGFEFNHYELWPNELTVDRTVIPVPVRAAESTETTVGSLNLFRLFDDFDDPTTTSTTGAPRNDFVVSTAEYERRRAKLASYIVDVLDSPDILAVQEAEKIEVLEDLAVDINVLDAGVNYTAILVEGNDIGTIDVGFLVRDNVEVTNVVQFGADELFTFDDPPTALHDRPPLLIEAICDGTFPISVMVLHMRSLGGIEDGPRVAQKRFEQAVSVAGFIQDIQIADPDVNLVVTGDFNAFEFTDGFVDLTGIVKGDFVPAESVVCQTNACVDLVSPDLTDQVLNLPAEERYSFIFHDSFNPVRSRADSQVLDHALTSAAMDVLVQGYEYGRGNADAAEELVEDPGIIDELALRSSDHDGLVLFVLKDEDKDGVPDAEDVCLGTEIPESVPTQSLGTNRFALVDGDGIFDTTPPNGQGPGATFTIEDTAGCSCEQIIVAQGLGQGHEKFGCSLGAMKNWVALVSP